jgi:hypothetical protein
MSFCFFYPKNFIQLHAADFLILFLKNDAFLGDARSRTNFFVISIVRINIIKSIVFTAVLGETFPSQPSKTILQIFKIGKFKFGSKRIP